MAFFGGNLGYNLLIHFNKLFGFAVYSINPLLFDLIEVIVLQFLLLNIFCEFRILYDQEGTNQKNE